MNQAIKQYKVKLNYLRIAPRKVRLIANVVKNLSVNEAEAQLMMTPNRSAGPLLKLLRSGLANVKHSSGTEPGHLIVKNILVDSGPMLKRNLPRAMGRATMIQKKSSHITLILEEFGQAEKKRFNIVLPEKKKTEGFLSLYYL